MPRNKANHVERLLAYPGHDCPCCAGRYGFERGLEALIASHPFRTRKEILEVNPLYIRQLPSFRHQKVHVCTMMAGMPMELLPRLFKKWSKHLQSYPEMPYLLHFVLTTQNQDPLQLPAEILSACEKASPFKRRQPEWGEPVCLSLKKRLSRLEVVQEILRNFASLLDVPEEFGLNEPSYLPQLTVLYSDYLNALQVLRNTRIEPLPLADALAVLRNMRFEPLPMADASPEEIEQGRNANLFMPTIIDSAFRDLAASILPAMIRASKASRIHSLLSEFFVSGGSYRGSSFDIASLVLATEPELLLLLDSHRDKLNSVSIEVLNRNLDEVNRTLQASRAEATAREERQQAERVQRLTELAEQEREHERVEAQRAERRAAVQAARSESLPDMTRRLSGLDPLARMNAVAVQIGYAPASFPDDWAREFGKAYIARLDATTLQTLVEKTRGVQRGGWKILYQRVSEFIMAT